MFSKGHILGTDNWGVDQLSAMINGTRISLGIAVVSVVLGAFLGAFLGVMAGYTRGWIDAIISMYFNVTLAFPTLVLLLTLVAIFASPDPFNPGETIEACPKCREIGTLVGCCDLSGCRKPGTSGIPSPTGYLHRCHEHYPERIDK
jgi:ABC-type dipeptide/oligopeptide/nickel transport system permease subunit